MGPRIDPTEQRYDVFLSYGRRDGAVVEQIAQRLQDAGLRPWLDIWALTPGEVWPREIEAGLDASGACAVFLGPSDLGDWEREEFAMAVERAVTQPGFRVFAVLLPGVEDPIDPNRLPGLLRTRGWVDLRGGLDDEHALGRLVGAVGGAASEPEGAGDDVIPYRGLRAFEEADARWFFGRDAEVQRLVEKLKSNRFVAVVGPSGSGKSSLVRAGLVPALRAAAAGELRALVLRPGHAPLTALAAQLAELRPDTAMQATLDGLARDERTLHLCVELALAQAPGDARALVVLDQLEEVFTLCRDEDERRRLFATLLYAVSAPGGRTVVVVTMRDDFYGRCAAYPELAQLVAAQQLLVGPLTAERAAIRSCGHSRRVGRRSRRA